MRKKKQQVVLFALMTLLFLIVLASGCSLNKRVPQWSGSGFIKKEFLEYKRVSVLPFEGDSKGEASNTFASSFHEKFPQIAIVERKQILKFFQEQDLYPNRLDEETRIRIGKVFDVQAIIQGSVYYPSILRWLLQVIIIDTEKNEVMGRSLVEINFMGTEGIKEGCNLAVQMLTPR